MAHQQPFAFAPELVRRDDAWRFFHGTPNIPALYAARPGLEIVNEIGIEAIRAKSLTADQAAARSGRPAGYRCTTPRDPARRGGTVAIDVDNGYEISQSLKALDILCDYRPGAGIRLSPHFYNRDDELDAAIAAIGEIRSDRRLAGVRDRKVDGHVTRTRAVNAFRPISWPDSSFRSPNF